MKFPSLLFTSEARRGDVSAQVFDDLKLNTLLDGRALEVMSGLPSRADAARRAELFDLLGDAAVAEAVRSVASAAEALRVSYDYSRAHTAASAGARAVLFVRRMKRAGELCRAARALSGRGFFLDRFAKYCAELEDDPDFAAAVRKSGEAADAAGSYACVCFTADGVGGETPCARLTEKGGEPFAAALRRISRDFGIPVGETRGLDYAPTGEFIDFLLSADPDAEAAAINVYEKYRGVEDASLCDCADELHFIISLDRLLSRVGEAGIPVCRAVLTADKAFCAKDLYDVTLLAKNTRRIVPNDLTLTAEEPFFFLSGANGGGKTTYLRALGVNLLLALNCGRAAAASASAGPIDGIFTHFPGDETFHGEGRYANEVARADDILASLGDAPVVLLNETFSTTTRDRSADATRRLARELRDRGALGVYVTHAQNVSVPGVGSLVCEVDPDDSNARTYRIVRGDGGTKSYAADILGKYSLTPEALARRFPARGKGGEQK